MPNNPAMEGLRLPHADLSAEAWQARREALLRLSVLTARTTLEQTAALLAHGRMKRWRTGPDAVVQLASRPATDLSRLNPHGLLLEAAAQAAGLRTTILGPGRTSQQPGAGATLRIETPTAAFDYRQQQLFHVNANVCEPINGPVAADLFLKHEGKAVIEAAGGAPPHGALFGRDQISAALAFAASLRGEICIKPNGGANGHRVFPALRGADEVVEAIAAAAAVYDQIVVEESLPGEAWRFFYVAPQIVGIKVARLPAVTGDGVRTIASLIEAGNARRAERSGKGPAKRLPAGLSRDWMLRRQGLTLESVVPAGSRVFLSPCSNGSQGAESLALPDRLDPDHIAAMTAVFRAIPGLQVGAADVMIAESGRHAPGGLRVVEINMAPSLLAYHFPAEGPVQDVAGAIVRRLMTLGSSDRVSAPESRMAVT